MNPQVIPLKLYKKDWESFYKLLEENSNFIIWNPHKLKNNFMMQRYVVALPYERIGASSKKVILYSDSRHGLNAWRTFYEVGETHRDMHYWLESVKYQLILNILKEEKEDIPF